MTRQHFGWVETNDRGDRRWVCDCSARGTSSIQDVGTKIEGLVKHFHRMHEGWGTVVHGTKECSPPGWALGGGCPFHRPSDHPTNDLPKHIRFDRCLLVERICRHGCGHPDPDSLRWVNEQRSARGWGRDDGTHGCDGCCSHEARRLRDEQSSETR